ncbi:hypothetical protein BVRB_4g073310 [Beta vulgaris subsp. vulgaris]|nr:hypothetical protein BVRB_4g073310 [Beta vulgaris subsp. vulgaris]
MGQLHNHRARAPSFLGLFRQSTTGVVEPGHCQGSIFKAEYARRMAAKNGGVLPKAVDIYLETHSKERQSGQDKQLIGSK